jgi:hypothetical protein
VILPEVSAPTSIAFQVIRIPEPPQHAKVAAQEEVWKENLRFNLYVNATLKYSERKQHLTRTIKKTAHQRNTETAAFQKRYEENINDVTERRIFD